MPKILVVYYSLGGHTRTVAEVIAKAANADLDPILDAAGRTSRISDILWFAMEAVLHQLPDIKASDKLPDDYDLVMIGTPVWAAQMAPPVRSYVERNRGRFKAIALFCTEGGANGDKAIAQIASLAGLVPKAELIVTDAQIASGAVQAMAEHFVAEAVGAPAPAAG